jgi:hypothetical protein
MLFARPEKLDEKNRRFSCGRLCDGVAVPFGEAERKDG